MKASKKRGFVGALALAGVFAIGGYALTNTITFEDTSTLAGFGTQTVQVLEVTDTDYTTDADNSNMVDAITFTLDAALVTGDNDPRAFVRYNDVDEWVACDTLVDGATSVVCTFDNGTDDTDDVDIETIGKNADNSPHALELVLAE